MNAVIYARYSSHSQTEQSIEGQLKDCNDFAAANDITIIGTYIDRAVSGRTDNRTEFQRMLKDSNKRLFEAVLVWKIDRFGRNREETAFNKVKLRKNGVKILYAKEHIPDGPEGIILEGLLESMAEFYSADLSQKITRGMTQNALKCKSTGGNIALGYRINEEKKFEIEPQTAPIVRSIFKEYNGGKTTKEICNELNKKGFRTSRGVPFNKNSLHRILTNEKYIGIYRVKDIVIEGGVPSIIENSIFEGVQQKMMKNKKAPAASKATVDYLLTGKLFCGKCGGNMVGESGTSKTKSRKHHYYICATHKRLKTCDKKAVKKDWIERLVVEVTVKTVLVDAVIDFIAEKAARINEKERNDNSILNIMQNELKDVEKSLKNLLSAIEQGILTPTTKNRFDQLEAKKEEINVSIAKETIKKPTITKEHIVYYLEQFKEGNIDDVEYQRKLIDVFVNSVFVYDDKIVITYNYSGDNNKITFSTIDETLKNERGEGFGFGCGSSTNLNRLVF